MFKLSYSCKCGDSFTMLMDAQKHADKTGHCVDVHGHVTPSENAADVRSLDISDRLKRQLREHEILRRARDKGLLK